MIIAILWIICSLAGWYIYHSLFTTIYFDLANGCLKELIVFGFIGGIWAALIVAFWYISIPLAILIIIAFTKKKS